MMYSDGHSLIPGLSKRKESRMAACAAQCLAKIFIGNTSRMRRLKENVSR